MTTQYLRLFGTLLLPIGLADYATHDRAWGIGVALVVLAAGLVLPRGK